MREADRQTEMAKLLPVIECNLKKQTLERQQNHQFLRQSERAYVLSRFITISIMKKYFCFLRMAITTTTDINYIQCCTATPSHLGSYFLNINYILEALAMRALLSSGTQRQRRCSIYPVCFICHQERDTCSIPSCKTHTSSTGETWK